MTNNYLFGVYRTLHSQGKQYAFVECGKLAFRVSRRTYEAEGYNPPFDHLPSENEVGWDAKSENFQASALFE